MKVKSGDRPNNKNRGRSDKSHHEPVIKLKKNVTYESNDCQSKVELETKQNVVIDETSMSSGNKPEIPIIQSLELNTADVIGNKIHVNVQNVKVLALLDSGASISCLSLPMYTKLMSDQTLQESKIPKVQGVSGSTIQVLGKVLINFQIENMKLEHTFYVLNTMVQSMILGYDFLDSHKAHFDFETHKLSLKPPGGDKPQQVNYVRKANHILRLAHSVTIPPLHECIIPVKTKRAVTDELLAWPVDALSNKWSIAGARCICRVNQGITNYRVMNPTNQSVRLWKGCAVASLMDITDNPSEDSDAALVLFSDQEDTDMPSVNTLEMNNLCDDDYVQIANELGLDFEGCVLTEKHRNIDC